MKKLRVLSGPQAGATLELQNASYTMGSDEKRCDIVLFAQGVEAHHCDLEVLEDREAAVNVSEAGPVSVNGKALAPGRHAFELPAHVCVASADLLINVEHDELPELPVLDEAIDSQLVLPDSEPVSRSMLSRYTRLAASLVCLTGFTVFVNGALGWFEKAESQEVTRARQLATGLGYPDLIIQHDVEGLLTVTGYVRQAAELEQLKRAFRDFKGKTVVVRVAVGGAATQFDRGRKGPDLPAQRLGAGHLLLDVPFDASAVPAPAKEQDSLELRLRALQAGTDGYVETVAGIRYFVGSQMPGGYVLKDVQADAITVVRGEVEVSIPLR